MKRKQKPVIQLVATKHGEPVQPSLETDGRTVVRWTDPGVVWQPRERFVVSAWGRP